MYVLKTVHVPRLFKWLVVTSGGVLCSILGGILLVGGLYCVLWGKSKEQEVDDGICKPLGADVKVSSDPDETLTTKTIPPTLIV